MLSFLELVSGMDLDQGDSRASGPDTEVQTEKVRKCLIAPSDVLSTVLCGILYARLDPEADVVRQNQSGSMAVQVLTAGKISLQNSSLLKLIGTLKEDIDSDVVLELSRKHTQSADIPDFGRRNT